MLQRPPALLRVAREIRIQIYRYILRSAQVHIRCHPVAERNGDQQYRVTWKPCLPCNTYPGLCANPPWVKPREDTHTNTFSLMQTCKTIAIEMRAVLFTEAALCLDMEDISFLQNLQFGHLMRISIHGYNPCARSLSEAVAFARSSRQASLYIYSDCMFGLSGEALVDRIRLASWSPAINVARVQLCSPNCTETSTFTKEINGSPCLKQHVVLTYLGSVYYSRAFISDEPGAHRETVGLLCA